MGEYLCGQFVHMFQNDWIYHVALIKLCVGCRFIRFLTSTYDLTLLYELAAKRVTEIYELQVYWR